MKELDIEEGSPEDVVELSVKVKRSDLLKIMEMHNCNFIPSESLSEFIAVSLSSMELNLKAINGQNYTLPVFSHNNYS